MTNYTTLFDKNLLTHWHYRNYNELLPWVGHGYVNSSPQILLIGESHYMPEAETSHLNPIDWYNGHKNKDETENYFTREIVQDYIDAPAKGNRYGIFRNTDKELKRYLFKHAHKNTAYNQIAFMNYFQRPACFKKSFNFTQQDLCVSKEVCRHVINTLTPTSIIFVSRKAYHAATTSKLFSLNELKHIKNVPHPACAHWNMKNSTQKTGRERFIEAIKEALKN